MLKEWENKKILILGFGKEGKDTYLFLRKIFKDKILGIADKKEKIEDKILKGDKKINYHLGKTYLKSLKDYDIILKSPGIPIHIPEIERAFKEKKITSQTEIFLKFLRKKVIGVTGTKGKSTTSSLIFHVLKNAGFKVNLVGNIGTPVLNFLLKKEKNDYFVSELSAHQLYNLKISPHIAIFLNFYPEHLDYYKSKKEYFKAKANIAKHQEKDDYFIFNDYQKILKDFSKKIKSKKYPISICKIKKNWIYFKNKKIIDINKIRLLGDHNLDNLKFVIILTKILNIDDKILKRAIYSFKPLSHRLEFIGNFKGIKFINDSIATIPEATVFAISAIKDVDTLILGGFDRNLNFKKLAKEIKKRKIKNLIFFPDTGKKIYNEILKIKKKSKHKFYFVDNMRDAVKIAFLVTKKRKSCLLSPASASFNLFSDYKERGNLFKKYVKYYGRQI